MDWNELDDFVRKFVSLPINDGLTLREALRSVRQESWSSVLFRLTDALSKEQQKLLSFPQPESSTADARLYETNAVEAIQRATWLDVVQNEVSLVSQEEVKRRKH